MEKLEDDACELQSYMFVYLVSFPGSGEFFDIDGSLLCKTKLHPGNSIWLERVKVKVFVYYLALVQNRYSYLT